MSNKDSKNSKGGAGAQGKTIALNKSARHAKHHQEPDQPGLALERC